jgi:hypothetical protein
VLIDLGDVTVEETTPGIVPRWTVPVPRVVAVVLVAVLVLAGAAASDRAAAGSLRYAGRFPIGAYAQFLISGDRAVVVDAAGSGATITAYALPGARRVWTRPLPKAATGANVFVEGSTVVLDEPSADASTDPDPWRSGGQSLDQGFDLRTGRELWSLPSDLVWPTPAGLVIAVEAVLPPAAPGSLAAPGVELVDPVTGAIRWHQPMAAECSVAPADSDGGPTVNGLVEMCPATQELIGIDLATGRIRARRQVDLAGLTSPYVDTIRPELMFVGSIVVAAVQDRTRIVLSAFRTGDFAPLWTGYPVGAGVDVSSCAPYLCIDGGTGQVVAVDPRTGVKAPNVPPQPLMCCNAPVSFLPRFGVAEVVVVPADEHPALASWPVTIDFETLQPAGTALTPTVYGGRTTTTLWVGEQVREGDAATVRTLGSLPGLAGSCRAVAADAADLYLACTTATNRVSLWRIRSDLS